MSIPARTAASGDEGSADNPSALRRQVAEVMTRVAEQELLLQTLEGELAAFEQQYQKVLGPRYAELRRLEAQLAELVAAMEPDNPELQQDATYAKAQAEAFAFRPPPGGHAGTDGLNEEASRIFTPSDDLKSLYRRVAKAVHPDGATSDTERELRTRLMAEANAAYQDQDRERLEDILLRWNEDPVAVGGDGTEATAERLRRQLKQLTGRLSELERRCADVRNSDRYLLKLEMEAGDLMGTDRLVALGVELDGKIAALRARVDELQPGTNRRGPAS